MPRTKRYSQDTESVMHQPLLSVEGRENQLISLAVDLAEKQLREGTASTQVITHFLRLGTTMAELEKEKLRTENDLRIAKKDSLERMERIEDLYKNALDAMKLYSGKSGMNEDL